MAEFERDEVEQAFIHYWRTGAVGEDWEAWADLFTDDATYVEHVLGNMHGRDAIKAWIRPIMDQYSELYTAYEWHMIDGDRVVMYMQNRRDDPEEGQPPIDFPGISVLRYAGDGKWSYEEDFWSLPGAQAATKRYAARTAAVDPGHAARRTRRNWPAEPAWAHP